MFRERSERVIFYFLENHSGCRSVEAGSPKKLDLGDRDLKESVLWRIQLTLCLSARQEFHFPAL